MPVLGSDAWYPGEFRDYESCDEASELDPEEKDHTRERGEAFLLEGSADTTVFELSNEQILAPSLQTRQIVILDNLHTHTGLFLASHKEGDNALYEIVWDRCIECGRRIVRLSFLFDAG